jgi:hypothetical protein
MNTYIKGCPWCGEKPFIQKWHGGRKTKRLVSCENDDCPVQPMITGETKKEAIELWNDRKGTL